MNFSSMGTNASMNGAYVREGFSELCSDCFSNCRGACRGCERDRFESDFNIDNREARAMVVTCWAVFGLCFIVLLITLPITITNGAFEGGSRTSLIIFYCVVCFFFLVASIANFISCRSLSNSRNQGYGEL